MIRLLCCLVIVFVHLSTATKSSACKQCQMVMSGVITDQEYCKTVLANKCSHPDSKKDRICNACHKQPANLHKKLLRYVCSFAEACQPLTPMAA
jgi:phosphopantetheinyl transferase